MPQEIWKDISGYENLYQVSNLGRVKALERYVENNGGMQHRSEKYIGNPNKKGYVNVSLCKEGKINVFQVHRLVAQAFIDNPDGKPCVDHIDTNPSNNCVENLRWVTQKENCNNPLTREHDSMAKMGHEYWGRPLTEEERKKISNAHKGKTFSEEHKSKLSKSHIGKPAWNKGITYSSAPRSEEYKKAQSERMKGNHKGDSWIIVDGKRKWIKKGE